MPTSFHAESYNPNADIEFELNGSVKFIPRYYPDRVIQDKNRELSREKGICLGEYVNDTGGKNREFRVDGQLITPELGTFHEMIDSGKKMDLICMQWEGEVLIKNSQLKGPKGIDVETRHWIYDYTLQLVSSGRDERDSGGSGIQVKGSE